jgi:hypothetical protein
LEHQLVDWAALRYEPSDLDVDGCGEEVDHLAKLAA